MKVFYRKYTDRTPSNVVIPDHIADHFRAVQMDLRAFVSPLSKESTWAEAIEKTIKQVVKDADHFKANFPDEAEGRSLVELIETELLERCHNATLLAAEQSDPGHFVSVTFKGAWADSPMMIVEAEVRFDIAGHQGSAEVMFTRDHVSEPWIYDDTAYEAAHAIFERFGYENDWALINKTFGITRYFNANK